MKLEMTINGLDIKVELNSDSVDQLETLETVKSLIYTLSQYDFVDMHVQSAGLSHDFPDADPM